MFLEDGSETVLTEEAGRATALRDAIGVQDDRLTWAEASTHRRQISRRHSAQDGARAPQFDDATVGRDEDGEWVPGVNDLDDPAWCHA